MAEDDKNKEITPTDKNQPDDKDKIISDLSYVCENLKTRLDALEAKSKPPEPKKDDNVLAEKARLEREEKDKQSKAEKELKSALNFTINSKDWLKTNNSLLPKTIESIFNQAEKENYGSEVEKANAIKVGIISEFFIVQSNLDLLTASQKNYLEDFKKLTKDGKEEKASHIYDMVFEPALEMLKAVKKAQNINKGLGNPSDVEEAYKDRIMKGSRKHYLGEKYDA